MLFLQNWFWEFALVAIPVFWLLPGAAKLIWLLFACAVFQYHFAGPAGMAPVIVLAALTYAAALWPAPRRGPAASGVALLLVVGALVYYKYSGFLLANATAALRTVGWPEPAGMATWTSPALPLGISFFTFEFVHYLYEVRVHGREPIRNPLHFAVFALFFPTLAAGPIKRYPDFVPQLAALANPDPELAWQGTRRVIRGLFKKVCIADLLVEWVKVFEAAPRFTAAVVIVLAVAQGFRIYYDFAGYSDIAIGLAQLLNLRVPENFDRPYLATSLQDFWRRWHMSLSTWIRDYVYVPLGGNRRHRGFNLLAAMVLCGLWHGPAWNFAAWGLWHGCGLAVEAGVRRRLPQLFGDTRAHRLGGWALCYAFVTVGWLLFFYPLERVWDMTRGLLAWS